MLWLRHAGIADGLDAANLENGDRAAWARDPWSGEIADGRVHGRGTVDMKCGTTALLFVFAGQPSVALVIVIVAALLVVLGLIELLGSRQAAQPATP